MLHLKCLFVEKNFTETVTTTEQTTPDDTTVEMTTYRTTGNDSDAEQEKPKRIKNCSGLNGILYFPIF